MASIMNFSSLTNAEYFRLNGTLDNERIEQMLDDECTAGSLSRSALRQLEGEIVESTVSLGEDFLAPLKEDLTSLKACVRGENRQFVLTIMEKLDDLQTEINQAMEYQQEKHKSIIEILHSLRIVN